MHPLLKSRLEHKTVANTLLFVGPTGAGKRAVAQALAAALMGPAHIAKIEKGLHPDFRLVEPQGKTALHPVETIRMLTHESALPPFEAPCRVFVIDEAHRMLPTSSNALLKTLEEPAPRTYFVLLSTDPQSLLPTVVSRCQRYDFSSAEVALDLDPRLQEILDAPQDYPRVLAHLDTLDKEIEKEEDPSRKKIMVEHLIDQLTFWYRAQNPPPLSTHQFLTLIESCQLAIGRSMKLSVVLEYCLLNLAN